MIYILKHFDESLLRFETGEDNTMPVTKILWVNSEKQHFLPKNLIPTTDGLNKWIRHRVVPKNRAYVNALLSKCGLNINNPMNIISVSKGLSLNDCYWVVDEDFNGSFSKYNLYDNSFNRLIGLIAFTGYGSNVRSSLFTCPEFTTNGMLPKCWHRDRGVIKLYKGGTVGASNLGFEPYSEYYAYQIGKAMGIDVVEYNLTKSLPGDPKKTLCSVCPAFTSKEYSFIPIDYVISVRSFKDVEEYYATLSKEYQHSFKNMLIFDAIICNTDRHLQNFGFIVDNHTNEIIRTAPLFDHGLSLFSMAGLDEFDNFETLNAYAETLIPSLYSNFVDTAKNYLDAESREQLRHLLNFKFKRHPRYNLPPHRLKTIEKVVQYRARLLLS